MATTTYTDKLRLAKPTTGELFGTWGNLANTGITALVDDAIAGRAVVTHDDSASYTLTSNNAVADEARMPVLRITGTLTAARNVVCPTQPKLYIIENATTGGFAVTLKTSAGTGVAVAAGEAAMLRCDGTNVIEWMPVTGTGSLVKATSGTLTTPTLNSPICVTPALGTPASGVMTNVTGTAAGLTAGAANALKSATTTVSVSTATAPTAGQVLMATGASAATWQTVGAGTVLLDTNNVFTKNQAVAPVALTSGTNVAVDASLSNTFTLTAEHTFTLDNPTNLVDGMILNFRFKQDATGSRVVTWGSKYKFPGGTAGVLSTGASEVDFMSCYYDATSDTLDCVLNKDFS